MADPTRSRAAMCPCCAAGGCPSCANGYHAGSRSHDFTGPGHTEPRRMTPDRLRDQQRLIRLATWWHGAGVEELLDG